MHPGESEVKSDVGHSHKSEMAARKSDPEVNRATRRSDFEKWYEN